MEEKGFEEQFVCRACLKIVERTTQSFGYVDDATGNLRDLLMCCVPELDIYVSSNPIICFGCIQGLIQVHNFKSKCINTENIIRTFMHKYKVPDEQLINLGSVVKDVVEVNKFHKQQEDLRRQFLVDKRIIGNPINSSCPPPLIYHEGPIPSPTSIPAPVQELERTPTTYEQVAGPVLPLIIDTDQLRSLTSGSEQTPSPLHYQPSASDQILQVNPPRDHEPLMRPLPIVHLQPMDNNPINSFNPQLAQSMVPQQLQATGYGPAYTPISIVQPQNVPLLSPQNRMSMSSSHGPPLYPRFISSSMTPRYMSSTGGPQISPLNFVRLPPSTPVPTSLSVGTMRHALANKLNSNTLVNGLGVSSDVPPLVAIPLQQKRPAVESGSQNPIQRQESITNTNDKREPEYHPIEKKRRLVVRLPRMNFVLPSNSDAVPSFNQTESSNSYGASTEEQHDGHEVVPDDQEIANFGTDVMQEEEGSVIRSENGGVLPEHNIAKLYNCACMYLTTSQALFNEHKNKCQMSKIGSKQTYKCPHCTHVTNRPYAINKHINTMHTKSVWFMCESCSYKSTDKSCLRRHVRKNHEDPDPTKQYPCHLCDMVMTNKYNFKRHLLKHDEALSYDCEFCSYNCKDKSNFRKHLFTHSPKLLPCSLCAYNHVSPYQLRSHLKKHHEGVGVDKVDIKNDISIIELVDEIRTAINSIDNYIIPVPEDLEATEETEELEAPEIPEDS
uniref:B-cell lymphoma 6 protein homolog n=1 Tax=Diabrotica virgifera virgifera TaxID=50390 RepID=A0A6P7F8L6_DIAVI